MFPKVTIIIPIYNKKKYFSALRECLLNQTFSDFECIFVDDGSTDGSGELCDNLCREDERFIVYHVRNAGVSNARNIGLKCAKGRYVTFIDADDTFHNEYIENLYTCIDQTDAKLVITSSIKVWSNSDKQIPIEVPFLGEVSMEKILPHFMKEQLNNGIFGFCWGKIMERDLLTNKFFDINLKLAEDLSFYLSIYPDLDMIFFDNHPYYYYLQEAMNSSMQKPDWEIDYLAQLKILLQIKKYLEIKKQLSGENLKLLSSRIFDYVFFSIYYAPKNSIVSMCSLINKYAINLEDTNYKRSSRQKLILTLYKHKMYHVISLLIRGLRRMKRVNY